MTKRTMTEFFTGRMLELGQFGIDLGINGHTFSCRLPVSVSINIVFLDICICTHKYSSLNNLSER